MPRNSSSCFIIRDPENNINLFFGLLDMWNVFYRIIGCLAFQVVLFCSLDNRKPFPLSI